MDFTMSSEGLEGSYIMPAPQKERERRFNDEKSTEEHKRKRRKRKRRQRAMEIQKKAVAAEQTQRDADVGSGTTQPAPNGRAIRSAYAVPVDTEQKSAELPFAIDKEVRSNKLPLVGNSPKAIAARNVSPEVKDIQKSRNLFDPKDDADLVSLVLEDDQPQGAHSSRSKVDRSPILTTPSPRARTLRSDAERFSIQYPEPPSDMDSGTDIEETIITAGAQATLSRPSRTPPNIHPPAMLNAPAEDSNDEVPGDAEGEQDTTSEPVRQIGFPRPEELPKWFPERIKKIYEVDRHGGALTFRELDQITRFRFALSPILRRKWKTYLAAGQARFKLQNVVRRLGARTPTKAFYELRKQQYRDWKARAFRAWRRLEKTHLGVVVLDATIGINFRQERIIYEKKLGGRS